jgi:hypothetical protein
MEAEDLVNRTDFVSLHGTVLLTRARVFELAGRPEQAVAAGERALELFEGKENRVWARKTEEFLASLPPSRFE